MTTAKRVSLVLASVLVRAVLVSAQGMVTTPVGPGKDEGVATALDPSGRFIVAGFADSGTDNDIAVVRYNPDLTLDTTFDGDGIATLDLANADDRANAVAVQPDGKIVVVGFYWTAGTYDLVLLRYNVDGSLDNTFSGDGIVTRSLAGDDQGRGVAIQDDGKIVVAGYTNNGGDYDFFVARYTVNGSPDTSFNGTGIRQTDFGGVDNWAQAVAIQDDGKIVVVGDHDVGAVRDYMVVRYNPDGTIDTSFDTDGIQTTDFLSNEDNPRAVIVQSDQKIVVTGSSNNGTNLDFSAARYNANGSLDTTFSGDGKQTTDLGGWDLSFGVDIGAGGTIVIAGHSNALGTWDFAAIRYTSNGVLDPTFDTDGIVITPIGAGDDLGFGVAIESSGNILVGGDSHNGTDLDFAAVRYCPNGSLQTNYSNTFGYRKAITISSIQVAGSADLVDFPVLVHVTDPDLRTTGFGGRVEKSDGADIVFREGCFQAPLDHELELYVPNTGELVAWVRVPLLYHNVDTVLFMYYGNATVGCPTENPAGAWSNEYRGVWHLQESPGDPAPQFIDSTSSANQGTAVNGPTSAAGQVGNALQFDDTNERHVLVPHDASLQLPAAMTVSAWVSTIDTGTDVGLIASKWANDPLKRNYWLGKLNDTQIAFVVDDTQSITANLTLVNDGTFHHVVGVADVANNLVRIYVDGIEATTPLFYTGTSRTDTGQLRIGNSEALMQEFDGTIDEVRVAAVARSSGWLETEFRNQGNPGGFYAVGAEQAAPFNAVWEHLYRKKITIDNTKVCGSTNLLDFPLLVSFTDPDLRTVANGGKLENGSGYDILFRDDTLSRNLDFEVEQYDPVTGELVAWVRIPSLSFNTDTDIYMYYGNPAVSCGYQSANPLGSVWNSNYKGVWHFNEDPSGAAPQVLDRTVNRNHGTSFGAMTSGDQVPGKIGGSLDFDGLVAGGDYIDHGTDPSLDMGAGDYTLQTWFRTTDPADSYLAGNGMAGTGGKRYLLTMRTSCGNGQLKTTIDDDVTSASICSTGQYDDGLWHHAVAVREGNNLRLYADGNELIAVSPVDITGVGNIDDPRPFTSAVLWDFNAGPGPNMNATLAGQLDELRVSNVARSACWIQTEFDNQNSPGTFYAVGLEESGPGLAAAVTLTSYTAEGREGEVLVEWRTGSELENLGFHLYRSLSEEGARERLTATAIPGLGSSPVGATYSYRDTNVQNGVTYYYWLEDIETTGKMTLHGPVSAMPTASAVDDGGSDGDGDPSDARIVYGDPSRNAFRVVTQGPYRAVVELETHGFYAEPLDDGTVVIELPGFEELWGGDGPAVPVKRAWIEAVAGRGVKIGAVRTMDETVVGSLRPAGSATAELVVSPRGSVRAGLKRIRGATHDGSGLYPEELARVVSAGFQGETKKALIELAPLQWDAASGRLMLAKRLVVNVLFYGRDHGEHGAWTRRPRSSDAGISARFHTSEKGLYRARFEDLGFRRRRGLAVDSLRLSRQGKVVPFRLDPAGTVFGPGSSLLFVSEGGDANPYGREAVYELSVEDGGVRMEERSAAPPSTGDPLRFYRERREHEKNRFYQPALLDAPDLWLWDMVFAPATKSFAFDVDRLAPSGPASLLTVWLQGASDFRKDDEDDHHVRLYLNGVLIDELSWDGKNAARVDAELPAGVLKDGSNTLEIENVGDTSALYSMIMLDRFAVEYSRWAEAEAGRLEGTWDVPGIAEVSGFASGAYVLDVSGDEPRFVVDCQQDGAAGTVRFGVQAGESYRIVSPDAVRTPRVVRASSSRLEATTNGADYLAIGPAAFLAEAEPLLELRRRQGLRVMAASVEEIYAEFGYGEEAPESIRAFIAHAYHYWSAPSLRYVVLLGDGTYDFKNYLGTGMANRVPPLMVETSYLWTASDATYGAVNGDDILPDVAVGRLPAASLEELRVMVEKIVAFETSDRSEPGGVFLVADNPDAAGDFELDANSLAAGVLSSRSPSKIFIRELAVAGTRQAVREAFDGGAELMSYLGHGGIDLWAHENIFNLTDVDALASQTRQPVLLTMNCLNGYFHFPYSDSLAERLLEAEGKGVIAAFSPSGLSLNAPAHIYHRSLLEELVHGGHQRLGDAVLAAQETYAETGAFPELLRIYVLLGDPATTLAQGR